MFANYLTIALRNLTRQKAHSFMNILGLAIGLTCSMAIFLWVQDELSFDRFNEKADDLYRVVETQRYSGGKVFHVAVTPTALSGALKREVPEVAQSTRFAFMSLTVRHGDKSFTDGVAMADSGFLDMFTLRFLEGNASTALTDPHSMVLTRDAATRYFGNEDPLGKILKVNNQYEFAVTGVVENLPHNSQLQYDLLAPFPFAQELGSSMTDWNTNWCYTYLLLHKGAPLEALDKKISGFIGQHTTSATEIHLQPLEDIHLYSAGKYGADLDGLGDIEYVRIFSGIAIFVLLIACANFMNLATARSERRAKEVGLRKVIGASRSQLILQFFGEAMLMTFVAFGIALILLELILPEFNDLSGKMLALHDLSFNAVLGIFCIALVTGGIAGSYPALVLSSFQPVDTMKKGKSSSAGGSTFRRILVVTQFTLSIIMIIGSLVVSRQIDYIRGKNLGLNKENVGYVWMPGSLRTKEEIAKGELLNIGGITSITLVNQLPTNLVSATSGWDWEGKSPDANVLMNFTSVDDDFVKTFQMQMAAGRFFSPTMATDSLSAIVNETAVRAMGIESPIGKKLVGRRKNLTIIGVVKDFNFKPIRTKIEPLVLLRTPSEYYAMVIRTKSEGISTTIADIEKVFRKFAPETPFNFNFLNEDYDHLYRSEERVGRISGYFTFLACFIAALGLYGLASYTTEQRTKEIGIRKVLGATTSGLFLLLTREFVLLTLVANVLGWPVAYYFAEGWLQSYAYHRSLGPGVFLAAGGFALVIVIVTVGYRAVRSSFANPVDALRYE